VEERLSFYIRPADGLQLPAIMQWLKQTFAVCFNRRTERIGHIWGDRYWSRVLEGESPEGAAEVDWEAVEKAAETGEISFGMWTPTGVSPLMAETPAEPGFSPKTPPDPRLRPLSPKTLREHRRNHPMQCRQTTAAGEICPLLNPDDYHPKNTDALSNGDNQTTGEQPSCKMQE
jgi:hypothetical protein